jgi:hypothetical protein
MTMQLHHATCVILSSCMTSPEADGCPQQPTVGVYHSSSHPTHIGRGQAGQGITSLSLGGLGRHVSKKHVALRALPTGQGGVVAAPALGAGGIWVLRANAPKAKFAHCPMESSLEVGIQLAAAA